MAPITPREWDFVVFCDQFWRENGCFPADEEIKELFKAKAEEVLHLTTSEVVAKQLIARGIDKDITAPAGATSHYKKRRGTGKRLSDIQLAVSSAVLNPADKRSLKEKLSDLGVAPATYYGWKKNKHFTDFMADQSDKLYGEFMPEIERGLVNNAVNGDFKSAKLIFEMTGKWRGVQNETGQDFKVLVLRLIEVLQKYITDPAVLRAIAEEIQSIAQPAQGANPSVANGGVVKGELEGR